LQPVDHKCETIPDEHPPEGNRQEISEDVSENIQNAQSLKRLLLGRSYAFYGRIEPEYAAYQNGVLKDEDGFDVRRVRVGMVGELSDKLSYKGEVDLTDKTNSISDFYLK
jgi:hypothetical protein